MNKFILNIDNLKHLINYLTEEIENNKSLRTKQKIHFLNTKEVSEILKLSTGQTQRLFLREDFPACNFVRPQMIEYNAFIQFLKEHQNENDNFKNTYDNLKED